MMGNHGELTEILHLHCGGGRRKWLMTMTNMEEQRETNAIGIETTKNAFQTNPGWGKSVKK
jgi:hypothetical protein